MVVCDSGPGKDTAEGRSEGPTDCFLTLSPRRAAADPARAGSLLGSRSCGVSPTPRVLEKTQTRKARERSNPTA